MTCSSRSASSWTSSTSQAERLGEVELEQAVVADHLERDALAGGRQVRAVVRARARAGRARSSFFTIALAEAGETRLVVRERADRHAAGLGLELVDALQVVLDRLGQLALLTVQGNVVGRADPRGTQRRPRRRLHGLGARGGHGRHARARARAGRLGHPDAERVGARGPARGDRVLGRPPIAEVADRYLLLPHGASFGEGYGPIVVARRELSLDELRATEIVIPGRLTTAYLALRLAARHQRPARARAAVRRHPRRGLVGPRRGRADHPRGPADLRRRRARQGARHRRVVAGGETGLPLPLGLVGIRRDVERAADVAAVLREAIDSGLEHRDEAMAYAAGFGRGIDAATADEFVAMYVNDLTLDMGERGRRAVTDCSGSSRSSLSRPSSSPPSGPRSAGTAARWPASGPTISQRSSSGRRSSGRGCPERHRGRLARVREPGGRGQS